MEYVSGEKNIGSGGRKIRYLEAFAGFSGLLIFISVAPQILSEIYGILAVLLLTYFGFYNFIQAEKGFCGTYAALGLHYGEEGLERTGDEEDKRFDRKISLKQNIHSLAAGLMFAGWILVLYSL
ncbi:MAG: hypothetical protein ABEK04_04315 [Candidatus Nanohalobium sp.]